MEDYQSGCRIDVPDPATLDTAQREIYDRAVAFLGAPIGPRMVFLDTPDIAARWAALLDALKETGIPPKLWELAILIVAREWNAQFEWWAHEKKALSSGLEVEIIDAIRHGRRPIFRAADEEALYEYCQELYRNRKISDPTYERLRNLIGTKTLIELTVLIGHYNNVAITLVAHRVNLPKGTLPPLPDLA